MFLCPFVECKFCINRKIIYTQVKRRGSALLGESSRSCQNLFGDDFVVFIDVPAVSQRLLDAFYHSIGSNILDVHVLYCCAELPDIKVSLALWKIVTHIHMLKDDRVVKRGKIGVDWKIWLKFPLQNSTQKKATMLTVFENHKKSLIQHSERSELHLHFLSEQKLIKIPEKRIWSVFENLKLSVEQNYQKVTFNRIKCGKCQNWKSQMRHFE